MTRVRHDPERDLRLIELYDSGTPLRGVVHCEVVRRALHRAGRAMDCRRNEPPLWIDEAKALGEAKLPLYAIGIRLGVDRRNISRALKRMGLR